MYHATTSATLESLTPQRAKWRTVVLQLHAGLYNNSVAGQEDSTEALRLWWTVASTADDAGFAHAGLEFVIVSDKIAPSFLTSSLGSGSVLAVYATVRGGVYC